MSPVPKKPDSHRMADCLYWTFLHRREKGVDLTKIEIYSGVDLLSITFSSTSTNGLTELSLVRYPAQYYLGLENSFYTREVSQ